MIKQISELKESIFEDGDYIRSFIGTCINNKRFDSNDNDELFIVIRKKNGFDYKTNIDSFVEFIKNKINTEKKS